MIRKDSTIATTTTVATSFSHRKSGLRPSRALAFLARREDGSRVGGAVGPLPAGRLRRRSARRGRGSLPTGQSRYGQPGYDQRAAHRRCRPRRRSRRRSRSRRTSRWIRRLVRGDRRGGNPGSVLALRIRSARFGLGHLLSVRRRRCRSRFGPRYCCKSIKRPDDLYRPANDAFQRHHAAAGGAQEAPGIGRHASGGPP